MKKYLLLICFLFFASGCGSSKKVKNFEGIAMTIPYTIQIGDEIDEKLTVEIESAIFSVFNEINQVYNNWNPDSEISTLNRLKAYEKKSLSPELTSFFKRIQNLITFTEGKYDPTMNLDAPSESLGWDKIHIENGLFWKEHDKTTLDFCGSAKGYTVDLIVEKLRSMKLKSIYVEWGGEIKTSGNHPEGRPWKIGIHGISHALDLHDSAIATSGNYFQNWMHEGKIYTHIINPETKKSLEVSPSCINSVSVFRETCFEADALATALMIFPSREEAKKWAEDHGIKIWIY